MMVVFLWTKIMDYSVDLVGDYFDDDRITHLEMKKQLN